MLKGEKQDTDNTINLDKGFKIKKKLSRKVSLYEYVFLQKHWSALNKGEE